MSAKVYFPGLNSLRFFAAFAVIITHVELMKKLLGFSSSWRSVEAVSFTPLQAILQEEKFSFINPIITEAGPLGVVFFFVLSGFLITYLLFAEKQEKGKIAIGAFYMRRIFRIWPLYYFIFILGFLVLPHLDLFYVTNQTDYLENNYWINFFLYLVILPNLALAFSPLGTSVPNIGQSWSIGVEEQFYIIWPLMIKYFKKPIHAIVWVTGIYMLIKVGVVLLARENQAEWIMVLKKVLAMSKIECMTIGGLGAYWVFYKKDKLLQLIYAPATQIAAILGIPFLMYLCPFVVQDGVHLAYALCFLIIILNVSTNSDSLIRIKNKLFDYLGMISYGIYMYHLLVIVALLNFMKSVFDWAGELSIGQNIFIYFAAVAITAVVSSLSYRYLETPFIRLKKRFTMIKSGEDAKEG